MGMSSRREWDNSTGKLTAAQKDCLRARLWESDLTGATVTLREETDLAWQAQLARGGCPAPDDDWRINCLTLFGSCPRGPGTRFASLPPTSGAPPRRRTALTLFASQMPPNPSSVRCRS